MRSQKWNSLVNKLESRLIRTLDVSSILIFDAIPASVGFAIMVIINWIAAEIKGTNPAGVYFNTLKHIEHGSVVLLFLAWAIYDMYDFFRYSARQYE